MNDVFFLFWQCDRTISSPVVANAPSPRVPDRSCDCTEEIDRSDGIDFVSKRKKNAIKRRSSALLIHLVAPSQDTRLCTKFYCIRIHDIVLKSNERPANPTRDEG